MKLVAQNPPPRPFRREGWRSPLRGPWLTATLGSLLLPLVLVVAATGFFSNAAYQPALGHNALIPPGGPQPFGFGWPASPSWLYALNQGVHVTVGIVAVPLLLAKLWSVAPRLFGWPPVRSPAHAIERMSILGLVGSAIFEFATGILNVQLYYPWHFNFVVAHYYGAWVFVVALTTHPVFDGTALAPRHVDLRAFVFLGETAEVAPVALTRVAPAGSMIVNSSRGGGAKDTWLLR